MVKILKITHLKIYNGWLLPETGVAVQATRKITLWQVSLAMSVN